MKTVDHTFCLKPIGESHFFVLNQSTMGMNKELIADQRDAIIYGYLKKDSYRHITDLINCRKTTVDNVIKKFCETGSVDSRIKRSGRPKLLTSTDRSNLKELVT